ncbi:hypothetical protein BGZ94_006947 [Podila epigama]|nr:hypothetical protein BGZ94_006947 [Podila epigama]
MRPDYGELTMSETVVFTPQEMDVFISRYKTKGQAAAAALAAGPLAGAGPPAAAPLSLADLLNDVTAENSLSTTDSVQKTINAHKGRSKALLPFPMFKECKRMKKMKRTKTFVFGAPLPLLCRHQQLLIATIASHQVRPVLLIGEAGTGVGSRIRGHDRRGGGIMREQHIRHCTIGMKDEYRTSKTGYTIKPRGAYAAVATAIAVVQQLRHNQVLQ